VDNSILNSSSVDFGWASVVDRSRSPTGDVAGVKCYEIWVSTDKTFSTWIIRENVTVPSYSATLRAER
jgi:hypothetical protein